ncbi:hypothetical protein C8A00DRAFT_40507 [Chaetomidium leptoderma]|uniref:DUF1749-domain-containing protein n=1 Tax=Chaetomidium leptoderma TaxID=669021 RepID=A0AAN6ZYW8_9PEZI|nr:hypothetical protein C8A00DRAFT_40507 [Chaetomidium leptoderma]
MSYPVQVHSYLPSSSEHQPPRPVQTYEHLVPLSQKKEKETKEKKEKNALVFIGGLGDGPHTIPYARHLATHLANIPSSNYTVFEARLSSAFTAFGYGSLAQDVRELADLVRFLRSGLGVRRVVLLGHSTGCQDCLAYAASAATTEKEEKVDGYVLQGPVSDREAIGMGEEEEGEVQRALRVGEGMVGMGKGGEVMATEVLPKGWRGSPVTAGRWCSLAGVGGDDDYFSSDLPDEKLKAIWGTLKQPVLILPSEKDEWVPAGFDVMGLVERWKSFCKPGIASELSGLIPDANHRVDNDAGQQWLADRVARFLAEIEGSGC